MTGVIIAVTGPREADVAAAIGSHPQLSVVRRCADLAEAIAVAHAGLGSVVVVSLQPGLNRDVLAQFHANGAVVVGVVESTEDAAALQGMGLTHLIRDVTDTAAWASHIDDATAHPDDLALEPAVDHPQAHGVLVAVWGPTGAPGRTTVAVNLAAELAQLTGNTIIADCDTYGGAVAHYLGLLDEAPGMAAVARASQHGNLTQATVTRHALAVAQGLRVLSGITRADRWSELSGHALDGVWPVLRDHADVTVVDCGFGMERDELLSYDTHAPQRNGATLSALAAADLVVAVGSAEPVGMQRFIGALSNAVESGVMERASTVVAINRVRASVGGLTPRASVADVVARHTDIDKVWALPYDRKACDASVMSGQTLMERSGRSALRKAIASLAAHVHSTTRTSADHRARAGIA